MDGMAALEVLRADPRTAGITVVAVTASVMPEERDRIRCRGLRRLHREAHRREVLSGTGPGVHRQCQASPVTDEAGPRTLLAVDDIPQNLKVLDAILTPRGYRVITASSGAEALEKVATEHPDLLLLDIVMPGMTGYEVCRTLRESPETRMLPIVMVTASGHEEKVKAIEAGADDFIAKPVDSHELLARVKSLLRVKEYQDTVVAQAAQLREWNQTLEQRGGAAGRRGGAPHPAAALPVAPAGRGHPLVRQRVASHEPPARDRRRLL